MDKYLTIMAAVTIQVGHREHGVATMARGRRENDVYTLTAKAGSCDKCCCQVITMMDVASVPQTRASAFPAVTDGGETRGCEAQTLQGTLWMSR